MSAALSTRERDIGLIAQEVRAVFPEVVKPMGPDPNGYQGIDYSKLTPVLIEAVKELRHENRQLRRRLDRIEKRQRN